MPKESKDETVVLSPDKIDLTNELRNATTHTPVRERLSTLMSAGLSEVEIFEKDHDPAHIQKALEAYQEALDDIQVNEHLFLWAKAQALHTSFIHLSKKDDLSLAINTYREAIDFTPEIFRRLPNMWYNLSFAYWLRHVIWKDQKDAHNAISAQREAILYMEKDDEALPTRLSELGSSLLDLFESSRDIKHITEGISVTQKAIGIMPTADPMPMNTLGNLFFKKFTLTDNLEDIDQALRFQESALTQCVEQESRFKISKDLAVLLSYKFSRTGDKQYIEKGLTIYEEELQNTPKNHSSYIPGLHAIGGLYLKKSTISNNVEDIYKAICLFQEAVDLTDKHAPVYPGCLNSLGNAYSYKYQTTSDFDSLTTSINIKQEAVDLTPENHPDLPGRLNDLGNSLHEKFLATGNLSDIHLAIKIQQQAVNCTPEGHPDLVTYLYSLGTLLTSRYISNNNAVDIDEAVTVHKKAVELTKEGDSGLPGTLSAYGIALLIRYERRLKEKDLDDGISAIKSAVELTPEGHVDLATMLNNLSMALRIKYDSTQKTETKYLEEAIGTIKKSIDITPETHITLHLRLMNLGNMLNEKSQQTKDLNDINESITNQQKALELTMESHVTYAATLLSLGHSHKLLYETNGKEPDRELAIKYFSTAALAPSSAPENKLRASQEWADMCQSDSNAQLDAYNAAFDLIPQLIQIGQRLENRYYNIQGISYLAGKAAATAISLGKGETAIEWLEQGRCIIWSQMGALHAPLEGLSRVDETLAVEFGDLSKKLGEISPNEWYERKGFSNAQKLDFQQEEYDHHNLAQKWHSLLQKIRNLAGFEGFLKPLSFSKITEGIPVEGPVVIINVDKKRCDALVVQHKSPNVIHVPLVNMTYEKAEQLQTQLHELLNEKNLLSKQVRGGRKVERKKASGLSPIEAVLSPLWLHVVKPIIDVLGFSANDNPPRVWWCPTGLLSFLPIHAAGMYQDGVKRPGLVASDYVVSLYTPTLSALMNHGDVKETANFSGVLAISQPNTPGLPPIPGTTKEVAKVAESLQTLNVSCEVLDKEEGRVDKVIQVIQQHSWVHLACHAIQHPTEPLRSAFHLYDGQLDLWTLMKKTVPNADFAFLSACETSVGYEVLPDEAVHLAAGMLFVGYKRIVGTMWSIDDRHAPKVASDIYGYMLKDGKPDSGEAARALHCSLENLKNELKGAASMFTWIPFIHVGL